MKRISLLLALVFCVQATIAGGIKKWVDSEGNVHFGDTPPPTQETEAVEVKDPATGNGSMVDPGYIFRRTERRRHHEKIEKPTRDYGERLRYRNAAVKGEILMGMTEDEVVRSRGRPLDINRSTGSFGVHEQWVYQHPNGSRYYIYLDNGEVTGSN